MSKHSELSEIIRQHSRWLESGNKAGKRADLSGAQLDGARLANTDLSGAILRGASLVKADLSAGKFIHADFSDANLTGARFTGSSLLLTDFTGADLSQADLCHTSAATEDDSNPIKRGPRFCDTNLQAATLNHAYCFASDFTGANLAGACFSGALLTQANFSGTDLSGVDLSGAKLDNALLQDSSLSRASLQDANLSGANLCNSNLTDTDICRADLTSANLAHAKVDGIRYNRQTRFRGIRLEGCYGSSRFRRFAEDQDYIEEFKEAHPNYYRVWMGLTDCGRSLLRVVAWSLGLSLLFSAIYFALGEDAFQIDNKDGLHWNLFTTIYYSMVTFTTLGFGDITPRTPLAAAIVMCEVVIGYVMLGILISILATKVARRS
jgi:uncharacterized protein YjbI with pentapeptide repeats